MEKEKVGRRADDKAAKPLSMRPGKIREPKEDLTHLVDGCDIVEVRKTQKRNARGG